MSKRQLNEAAPELLSAAKEAVKVLQSKSPTESKRCKALRDLQTAIDKAESPREWKFEFVVTPRTWEHIELAVTQWYVLNSAKTRLRELLRNGHRRTARRVYVSLDIDIVALKRLKQILLAYDPQGATSRAFDRLIEQMDNEVFNKPILEMLAETGL